MIVIGLAGAHRTGKTTLANVFADASGAHVCTTSTSSVLKRLGIDPTADIPFSKRLECQREILMQMDRDIESALNLAHSEGGDILIVDRTPVDALAYLIADVSRATDADEGAVRSYIALCRAVLVKHFSGLLQIQPGITFVPEEGKAGNNPIYAEHLNALITGASSMIGMPVAAAQMKRDCLDIEERVKVLAKFVRIVDEHMAATVARGQAIH